MAYADVEVRILKRDDNRYPVEITVDGEREFPRGYLDATKEPPSPTDAHYADAAYGQELFKWLFDDKQLSDNWVEIRGAYPQRRVRLRIDADEPLLHQVVWEALCEPERDKLPELNLAANSTTPFSRYLAGKTMQGKPILRRPIRILVAAPAQVDFEQKYPGDQYPDMALIDPQVEFQALQGALKPLTDQNLVQLTLLQPPITLAAIAKELMQGHHHVLHLVCHGLYGKDTQRTRLILADTDNKVKSESDTDVTKMLAQQLSEGGIQDEDRLRMVFLASCETAKRSSADAFRGLAPQLVAAGVPAVIAMQDQVGEQTAREFATVFYTRLLDHGQVDLAANEARQIVMAAKLPGPVIPVVFLRLRSGNLLGQRGQIYSQTGQSFWPFLLGNIEAGLCTIFIGPHINDRLLPAPEAVAEHLADKWEYFLEDRKNLTRVAQYIALNDSDLLRSSFLESLTESLPKLLGRKLTEQDKKALRKKRLSEVVDELEWATTVRTVHENEPYHKLAELPIGLYVTTNVDNFMVAALRPHKPDARREQPRWEQSGAQSPQYALWLGPDKDDPAFRAEHPVVFHLNGYDSDSSHLVLSEDDFMAHLVRLARDQDTMLPTDMLGALARHSLVFVGFKLNDWEFRTILQGLLRRIAQQQSATKRHVGVQLDVEQASEQSQIQARQYLERYLGSFKIDIYWGDAQQFVNELHSRWLRFQESGEYEW